LHPFQSVEWPELEGDLFNDNGSVGVRVSNGVGVSDGDNHNVISNNEDDNEELYYVDDDILESDLILASANDDEKGGGDLGS